MMWALLQSTRVRMSNFVGFNFLLYLSREGGLILIRNFFRMHINVGCFPKLFLKNLRLTFVCQNSRTDIPEI